MAFHTHETGASKDLQNKLRYDLIPPEVLEALAEVLTYGMNKYSAKNWEYGLPLEAAHGAAHMRHYEKWRKGIDVDEESGFSHISHSLCNLAMMVTQIKRGRTDLDDRLHPNHFINKKEV